MHVSTHTSVNSHTIYWFSSFTHARGHTCIYSLLSLTRAFIYAFLRSFLPSRFLPSFVQSRMPSLPPVWSFVHLFPRHTVVDSGVHSPAAAPQSLYLFAFILSCLPSLMPSCIHARTRFSCLRSLYFQSDRARSAGSQVKGFQRGLQARPWRPLQTFTLGQAGERLNVQTEQAQTRGFSRERGARGRGGARNVRQPSPLPGPLRGQAAGARHQAARGSGGPGGSAAVETRSRGAGRRRDPLPASGQSPGAGRGASLRWPGPEAAGARRRCRGARVRGAWRPLGRGWGPGRGDRRGCPSAEEGRGAGVAVAEVEPSGGGTPRARGQGGGPGRQERRGGAGRSGPRRTRESLAGERDYFGART